MQSKKPRSRALLLPVYQYAQDHHLQSESLLFCSQVFIPARTGQELRVRVRRVAEGQTRWAYGQYWTGDVWEVTPTTVVM